mgnify:CR=1 FL=1
MPFFSDASNTYKSKKSWKNFKFLLVLGFEQKMASEIKIVRSLIYQYAKIHSCPILWRAAENDLLREANAKTSEPTSFWRTNGVLFQSVICLRKWRHTIKSKSRKKWRKIHLYFHVYLKIIVWIFHFITVFRKHRFFLWQRNGVMQHVKSCLLTFCFANRSTGT